MGTVDIKIIGVDLNVTTEPGGGEDTYMVGLQLSDRASRHWCSFFNTEYRKVQGKKPRAEAVGTYIIIAPTTIDEVKDDLLPLLKDTIQKTIEQYKVYAAKKAKIKAQRQESENPHWVHIRKVAEEMDFS
jgi:hypothetical protein